MTDKSIDENGWQLSLNRKTKRNGKSARKVSIPSQSEIKIPLISGFFIDGSETLSKDTSIIKTEKDGHCLYQCFVLYFKMSELSSTDLRLIICAKMMLPRYRNITVESSKFDSTSLEAYIICQEGNVDNYVERMRESNGNISTLYAGDAELYLISADQNVICRIYTMENGLFRLIRTVDCTSGPGVKKIMRLSFANQHYELLVVPDTDDVKISDRVEFNEEQFNARVLPSE